MTFDNTRKKLIGSDEERAVSPVIGVILMVAITVILAAVIAAFVLDIGPGEPDPNAVVEVDTDNDEVELISLDNADAVVQVDSDDNIVDRDNPLTTSGQLEDLDSEASTIQAISVSDTDDLDSISEDTDVEEFSDANAIVENIDN